MKIKRKSKLFKWQERGKEGGICSRCNRPTDRLTVDHHIPVSWLLQLALQEEAYEWEENFALVCIKCNAFKANRIDVGDEKTVRLLKEVVNRL